MPKSIPRLVLDKVRLVPVIQTLPCLNKSQTQELNNVLLRPIFTVTLV